LNRTNQFVLILFILGLLAAYSVFQPFILPIVVAILLAMATSNLTRFISIKFKSKKLSTILVVFLMALLILAPIGYVATTGITYMTKLDDNSIKTILAKAKELVKDIPYIKDYANEYLKLQYILPYLQDISAYIGAMGTKTLEFIKDTFLVVVFYAVIVYYQEQIMHTLIAMMPTTKRKARYLLDEISSTIEIVFYSILVTAILEGFLFGVFISFYDFNGLLLGFIYGFASLIPVVGGLIVWLPVSLLAWSKFDASTAITIALYSILVISLIADTFIKPIIIKIIKEKLLKSKIKINELIIFFSIIAGIGSYGFWGMIIGPAVTTFLIATTNSYIEFNQQSMKDEREIKGLF
jgi:predicted PurR-regulated permease PerM